ncbi:hypothetical protein M427DRAFT_34869 [Gonapodya prolifera JEL478]|uniref:VOC domain-containing protein n=1 Tax=Gonapodya prolifera (strain JEL478) TaxID=1344416 RepID=A0A139A687_GONPJ|nr:hypothetical protein M427DRAFT_34869 [Gonapodya prolifera JEL478]|eukprot:KXS12316.1 hypothetical protein M427DRAFT_34869 [Gonapodya prolifera JEL478]
MTNETSSFGEIPVHSLNHISRETTNVRRLTAWYQRVLGFKPCERPLFNFRGSWLCLPYGYFGEWSDDTVGTPPPGSILLHILEKLPNATELLPESPHNFKPSEGIENGFPDRTDLVSRSHHIALRTDNVDLARQRLEELGIKTTLQARPGRTFKQVFFFDCDGNGVEVGDYNFLQPAYISREELADEMVAQEGLVA